MHFRYWRLTLRVTPCITRATGLYLSLLLAAPQSPLVRHDLKTRDFKKGWVYLRRAVFVLHLSKQLIVTVDNQREMNPKIAQSSRFFQI